MFFFVDYFLIFYLSTLDGVDVSEEGDQLILFPQVEEIPFDGGHVQMKVVHFYQKVAILLLAVVDRASAKRAAN